MLYSLSRINKVHSKLMKNGKMNLWVVNKTVYTFIFACS